MGPLKHLNQQRIKTCKYYTIYTVCANENRQTINHVKASEEQCYQCCVSCIYKNLLDKYNVYFTKIIFEQRHKKKVSAEPKTLKGRLSGCY